jgi:hypothetical protein
MKVQISLCSALLALTAGAATAHTPAATPAHTAGSTALAGSVRKGGFYLRVRDEFAVENAAPALADRSAAPLPAWTPIWAPPAQSADQRVNNALDTIQTFSGTRPFVNTSVAEGTIASFGDSLVSVHGASGVQVSGGNNSALSVVRNYGMAYSYSGDNGRHWRSAYLPPLPGSSTTLGFGSVDVDRRGNFYAAGIGLSADNQLTVTVNKSVNGGRDFGAAAAVDAQGRVDKSWLAVGPDPRTPLRDNIYLSWVSFDDSTGASVLRFARSIDSGRSYTVKTVFAPPPDPVAENPQNVVQFPMIATDAANGRVYIAFLQFGFVAQDYLRILQSDDGGETFQPLAFNLAGAPNPQVYPVTQPGTITECGATRVDLPDGQVGYFPNTLLTLNAGPDAGGSVSGLPRFTQATRVNLQPALAVSKGTLHLAWANSTSEVFGDPDSGARIHYLRSQNNGVTWNAPLIIDQAGAATARHAMPSIALGRSRTELESRLLPPPVDVHISYYAQLDDGRIERRLARSSDRGSSFPARDNQALTSTPSTLAPTNVPLPDAANAFRTTNYNRMKGACVSLGDYAGIAVGSARLHSVWGDSRESLTQPVSPLDPLSGQVHTRENVYYRGTPIR